MDINVRALLIEKRQRLTATILGYSERELWDGAADLDDEEWVDYRKTVIDAINTYHDNVLDVLKVMEKQK